MESSEELKKNESEKFNEMVKIALKKL